jgi:putative heme-binding domain-containing protein
MTSRLTPTVRQIIGESRRAGIIWLVNCQNDGTSRHSSYDLTSTFFVPWFSSVELELPMMRHLGFLVVCLSAAVALGDDPNGKIYTQAPEIARTAGRVPPKAKEPTAKEDAKDGPTPLWIWGADDNKNYVVRKTFRGKAKSARLMAAADNTVSLAVNGKFIGTSEDWNMPIVADIQKHLKDGENTIVAEVTNQGGPGGFVCRVVLTGADGKSEFIASDETWQVAESKDSKNFVAARKVATYGDKPWNDVFSGTGASTPGQEFNLPPGFQVERLFTVPPKELGSWVSMTVDDKGRLIVSDEKDKGLCRITPSPIGSEEPTRVERLDVKITTAQGMLHAFGALYVSVNGKGLYRCRDTDGDDQYDEVVELKRTSGGGEHGQHALRLTPDGKSILWAAGNHTLPPFERKLNAPIQTMGGVRPQQLHAELPEGMKSRLLPNWDEDLLTLRQWDGGGHAVGIMAPGGYIAKTDPEGREWEILSSGYRNEYDFALNADGEIFAYDADMEWDVGIPWYRPTRVNHATSGSEFGWRSGSGKWPAYYVDSLPAVVDIGPGSPVGVEFGYGTKFPAKYQRALYLCDWTFGTIYAVHLEPNGSTYTGVKEEFLSRNALPLTDVVVGNDGAMYFTVGGRGTQSELYRVTYIGAESTEKVDCKNPQGGELRALRHELEAYHRPGADPAQAVPFLVKHLAHADRFIRYAARVGLEHIPVEHWMKPVRDSKDVNTVITGTVGLARTVEAEYGPRLLARLQELDFAKLSEVQQLDLLRAYELVLLRTGLPDGPGTLATGASMLSGESGGPATLVASKLQPGPETVALGAYFEKFFPSKSELVSRELAILMIALESPQAAKTLVPILTRERVETQSDWGDVLTRNPSYGGSIKAMLQNQPDQLQVHLAFHLRNLQTGWTNELRQTYFSWFEKARTWVAGNSYQKYLTNIDNQAFDTLSDAEKVLVEGSGARKPYKVPELPKAIGPGKEYTLDELVELTADLKDRDFDNGKRSFAAARCIVCHRFVTEGGATGPDLTQAAGRFSFKDVIESIIDPSKVISDQYKTTIIVTKSGKTHTGRVLSINADSVTILVDPEDSTKLVTVPKSDIDEESPSPLSLMPKDLLKSLNQDEVLDLLAYVLSRGNKRERYFKR